MLQTRKRIYASKETGKTVKVRPVCPYCNHYYVPVDVHGHVQCSNCKTNIDPCCQGEIGGL